MCGFFMSGCSDDDPQGGAPQIPNALGAFLERAPDISGTWQFTSMVGVDGCGIELFPVTDEGVYQIDQADTETGFLMFDTCGTLVSQGGGTISPQNVATFSYEETFFVSGTCTLTLATEVTGISDDIGQEINGSYTLTASSIDANQDCGSTYPCDVSGPFTAQACPPASCEFLSCGG
jgi:hypothetical protein